jgi:site-specific recombinase XerD
LRPNIAPARRRPDLATPDGLRDHVIITLMLYTAVRSVEIHRANVAHLRQKGDRLVLMVQGKGSKELDEMVVIPRQQESLIREYVTRYRSGPTEDAPLFVSFSRRLDLLTSNGFMAKVREVVGNRAE